MSKNLWRSASVALAAMTMTAVGALAQAPGDVVISQVSGAGGFTSLGPKYDLVELFNRTGAPINLAGWSVQVGNAASTTWSVVPLTGTIPARGWYLVRTGASFDLSTGIEYTYDDSASPLLDTSAFTSPSGRAVLANTTVAFTACPVGNPATIDFLSWGTGQTCFEGTGSAGPGSSSTNPPVNPKRRLDGCQDTNDNAADFEIVNPAFRTSLTPPLSGSEFISGAASPNVVPVNTPTIVTVFSQACGGSAPTLTAVTGDFSAFGLVGPQSFTGSGTGPWSFSLLIPAAQPAAVYTVPISGTTASATTITGTVTFRTTPPPALNDDCANAVNLTGSTFPVVTSVNNLSSTADIDPGTCNTGTVGNFGVWYRFDATTSGIFTVTETSTQDIASGIWTVPTGSATCPTATTGAVCNSAETYSFAVAAGNTYYIQIGSSTATAPTVAMDLTFSFEAVAAPANDLCDNAVVLSTFPVNATVDNRAATNDVDPGICNTGTVGNFAVWYRFDATGPGVLTVNETSTQDIASGIWTVPTSSATCPTATGTAVCNSAETYTVIVAAGNTYYIQIGASSTTLPTVPMALSFTFEALTVPANDLCENATVLTTFPHTLNVDNRGATSDVDPGTCNTGTVGNFGVWYRIDSTVSGIVTINETGQQDIVAGVWSVPTSSAACPTATGTAVCNGSELQSFSTTPGTTYYIQISQAGATLPAANLQGTINFEVVSPPANDTCETAISLTTLPISYTIDNRVAGNEFDIGTCNTSTTGSNNGVWFRYDATANGTLLLQENSAQDIATGWYAIPTSSFVCPTSNVGATCNGAESFAVPVTAGNTYLFLITHSLNSAPLVGMNVVFSFFTTPSNDECAGALNITPGSFSVSTFNATSSAAPFNSIPCPTTASTIFNDVWFKWTAPASGRIGLVSNTGTTTSVRYAVYDGGASPGTCPTSSTNLGCAGAAGVVNPNVATPLTVVGGNTYYFQIGTTASTTFGLTEYSLAYIPDVVGACCVGSACIIQSSGGCTAAGGTYQGDAALCSATLSTVSTYTGGSIGAIVDSQPSSGISSVNTFTLNVPDSFSVFNVELTVSISHTDNSDVTIILSKDGRSQTMFQRGRRGLSGTTNTGTDFIGTYTFSDAGTALITDQLGTGTPTSMVGGTYRPTAAGALPTNIQNAFNGVQASGTWTLTILDSANIDSGSISAWSLALTRGVAPSCAPPTVVCCRGSTCSIVAAAACTTTGFGAGALPLAGSTCNASGNNTTPCCHANYNKIDGVTVPDIFAFLADWFANSPYAFVGGDGTGSGSPGVPAIFSFLGAWFAGCP